MRGVATGGHGVRYSTLPPPWAHHGESCFQVTVGKGVVGPLLSLTGHWYQSFL